jgi:hypothetical protein
MSSTYPSLIKGTAGWLLSVLNAQVSEINSELSASIVSAKAAPQFSVVMGDPLIVMQPTIAVTFRGLTRTRFAQHNYQFNLTFGILVLVPHAGDDTSMNFEMCSQIASDNLMSLFTDETLTLTPKIAAGTLGVVHALLTDFTNIINFFPRTQLDGKSIVRGFELPLTIMHTLKSQ